MEHLLWAYDILTALLLITAPIVFIYLLFFTAPYGRYTQNQEQLNIQTRWGWVLMELPAVILPFIFCLIYAHSIVVYILLLLWELHYINRTFIYPMRLPYSTKPMPMLIVMSGMIFNILNGYTNSVGLLISDYDIGWLIDPRFVLGVALFLTGFVINQQSDKILLNLRSKNDTGYKIPQGKLFKWISCPNYLGEILEWLGWAIAASTLAGFAFALWTIANLLPRALAHHTWYKQTFSDYPKERRALI